MALGPERGTVCAETPVVLVVRGGRPASGRDQRRPRLEDGLRGGKPADPPAKILSGRQRFQSGLPLHVPCLQVALLSSLSSLTRADVVS